VSGGEEDNAVVLDLDGDWSTLLRDTEKTRFALGAGHNVLVVVGSAHADQIQHATAQGRVLLALAADGGVNLVAEGLSALGLRLDGGDDHVGDLGAWLGRSSGARPAGLAPLAVPLFARGGDGNDDILAGTRDDELEGGLGDDTLSGVGGSDTFFAAGAWDGDDVMNGGDGFDQISYALRNTNLVLNGCVSPTFVGCEPPECACTSSSGEATEDDRVVNFESWSGGSGDDYMLGGPGDDTFFGGNGNDSLMGSDGSDLLLGQFGQDLLEGGLDEDICDTQPDEHASGCEI
jgi:Ca2+-binding RTX toxin-like protein